MLTTKLPFNLQPQLFGATLSVLWESNRVQTPLIGANARDVEIRICNSNLREYF